MRNKLMIPFLAALLGGTVLGPTEVLRTVADSVSSPAHATGTEPAIVILSAEGAVAAQAEWMVLSQEYKVLMETMKNAYVLGQEYAAAKARQTIVWNRMKSIGAALAKWAAGTQPLIMMPILILNDDVINNILYGVPLPMDMYGIYGGQQGGFEGEMGETGGETGTGGWLHIGDGGSGSGLVDGGSEECWACKYNMYGYEADDDPCNDHRDSDGIIASGDGRVGTYLLNVGMDQVYLDMYDLFERFSVWTGQPMGYGWQAADGTHYVTMFNPINPGVADIYEFSMSFEDGMGFPEDGSDPGPIDDEPGDGPIGDDPMGDGPMQDFGQWTHITSVSYVAGVDSHWNDSGYLGESNAHMAAPWFQTNVNGMQNMAFLAHGVEEGDASHWHSMDAGMDQQDLMPPVQ
jgi:hypothetical protein